MQSSDYINEKIALLGKSAGVPLSAWSSPDGLPNSVLQPGLGFSLPPRVCLRLEVSAHGDPRRLASFLKRQLGFEEGKDYQHHGNGMRGGTRYFDFVNPEAITSLEAFVATNGLHVDADEPTSDRRERLDAEMRRRSEETDAALAKMGYRSPPRTR